VTTGLLGGTFDPPHVGHLIVAQDAALALGLDRVVFMPAAVPPHKRHVSISPAAARFRMIELAIAGDARFSVDPIELERTGPSFTIDTIRTLAEREPDVDLTLLIGADQYAEFGTWRDPDEIRRRVRIAVLTRDGGTGAGGIPGDRVPFPHVWKLREGVVAVDVTRIDVSSTEVRRRVAEGLPVRYMVPAAVEQFIFEQKLYIGNGGPAVG
jgi:nicotinate-nucleotide adenylyltransferase